MKTPWHLWAIGGITLIWNGFAAMDYVMTQARVEAYMGQFTDEQRAFFEGFPVWVVAAWAVAVWSSVAGSALLLARSRHAVTAFGLALVAMAITFVHNFLLSATTMTQVVGIGAAIFTGIIILVAIALWLYARSMARKGVLR